MIPLRDSTPNHRIPFVNYALIALCTVVFVLEITAGARLDELIDRYALIPKRFVGLAARDGPWHPDVIGPLFSSMFLHGGLMHFGGNMLFLWIFGDNVEDRLGHLGYALFYLAGGAFAGLAHIASDTSSIIPTVGASGAIAAVMGAYFLLHPRARIDSLIFVGFFITTASIPAIIYLALWFLMQLFMGAASAAAPGHGGGVAWWAHTGGFGFGALAVPLLGRRKR